MAFPYFIVRASTDRAQLSKRWTVVLRDKDILLNGGGGNVEPNPYSETFEISKYHRERLLALVPRDELFEVFSSREDVPKHRFLRLPDSLLKKLIPEKELFHLCVPFIRWVDFQRVSVGLLAVPA